MKHERRPTLADVAARCGVSSMTASRALRPGTEVAAGTRARVEAAAKELGYRADPFLSTLVAYRANVKRPRHRASLAYVTNYPPGEDWKSWASFGGYWRGARERALELGYSIEEFSRHGLPGVERAESIVHHRGYAGLLLAPSLSPAGRTRLRFGELPAVALGQSLRAPRLHYAAGNIARAVGDALHELKKLGYRRPGFATALGHDARTEHHASSMFLGWQARFVPEAGRVPLCLRDQEELPRALPRWLALAKPDVVLSTQTHVLRLIEKAGYRTPDDIGFASVTLGDQPDLACAGMVNDFAGIGRAAMDLLHAQLLRGERGVPETPRGVWVDARWRMGDTVRRQSR